MSNLSETDLVNIFRVLLRGLDEIVLSRLALGMDTTGLVIDDEVFPDLGYLFEELRQSDYRVVRQDYRRPIQLAISYLLNPHASNMDLQLAIVTAIEDSGVEVVDFLIGLVAGAIHQDCVPDSLYPFFSDGEGGYMIPKPEFLPVLFATVPDWIDG